MPEYASSADIQRLIDAWSEKARRLRSDDEATLSMCRVAMAYEECVDALIALGPMPYTGDLDNLGEYTSWVLDQVQRGTMTPNQCRKLLGVSDA